HHAGAHRSSTPVVVLPLLWHLRRLLHHRPLLGTRSDSTTRQNESRRREHQNVLLHFKSPQKHTLPTNSARAISILRPRCDADRRRPGRKPDGLPPSARSDRATRRDGEGGAHPAADGSGDGGSARARSLEGLAHERFFVVIREREIAKQGRIFATRDSA